MSPPEAVPAATPLPALSVTASAATLEESKAPLRVRLPVSVETDKAPSAWITPRVSAPELTKVTSPPEETAKEPAKLLAAFERFTEALFAENLLDTEVVPPMERAAADARMAPLAVTERLPAMVLDESCTEPVAEGAALVIARAPAVTAPKLMAPAVEYVLPAPLRRSTVREPVPVLMEPVLITAVPESR